MLTIYPVAIFQYTIIYHFVLTGVRGGGAQPRAINYQPNIFGQKHDFQTKYFRRRRDFSIFFICLNRADLEIKRSLITNLYTWPGGHHGYF